jgi:hypothetical protein
MIERSFIIEAGCVKLHARFGCLVVGHPGVAVVKRVCLCGNKNKNQKTRRNFRLCSEPDGHPRQLLNSA